MCNPESGDDEHFKRPKLLQEKIQYQYCIYTINTLYDVQRCLFLEWNSHSRDSGDLYWLFERNLIEIRYLIKKKNVLSYIWAGVIVSQPGQSYYLDLSPNMSNVRFGDK